MLLKWSTVNCNFRIHSKILLPHTVLHLWVSSAVQPGPQSLVFRPQKEEGRCHVQYDQVLYSLKGLSLHCSWESVVHRKTFNITALQRS